MTFRPMKGAIAPTDLSTLRYPLIASEKVDGWRALVVPIDWARAYIPVSPKHEDYFDEAQHAIVLSAALKPISNRYVQRKLDRPELIGCDGELIASSRFNETSSAFATIEGEPAFAFHIFDLFDKPNDPFESRILQLSQRTLPTISHNVELRKHMQVKVKTPNVLEALVQSYLAAQAEGVIVRDPAGLYKYGRSTVKQQWMLKIKDFTDAEAVVVGVEEFLHNMNEPEVNQLGLQSRSHHKDNKVPGDKLGALICRPYPDMNTTNFRIGTGFTEHERQTLWLRRNELIGKIVKYKSMTHGKHEAPRHPVFLGFRDVDYAKA